MRELVSGVILAGGASRRMGSDKALISIGDRSLIEHVRGQLAPHVDELLVSADDVERYAFLQLPVIADREPDQGPLCALATCFERAKNPRLLVVSCDVPELPTTLLAGLLAATDDPEIDAALTLTPDARRQPLLACYRRRAQAAIEAALAAGKRRADAMLDAIAIEEVPSPMALWNLNTPQELEAYLRWRQRDAPRPPSD